MFLMNLSGEDKYEVILDQYFKYDEEIYKKLVNIKQWFFVEQEP